MVATTRRKQLAKAFLKYLMDELKAVYLCRNSEFPVAMFYANNFSLATQLDWSSRQSVSKIQTKVQFSTFSKEMISQEINARPTDITSDRFFLSDVNGKLNMNTLRNSLFIMLHCIHLVMRMVSLLLWISTFGRFKRSRTNKKSVYNPKKGCTDLTQRRKGVEKARKENHFKKRE